MPGEQANQSATTTRNVRNKILLGIPSAERETILKKVEFVELPRTKVLNEAGQPIKQVYFINSGLASVLNVMNDGKLVEVGLAGAEGLIGLPLLAGFKSSAARVIMQVGGSGYAMSAKDFLASLEQCPTLATHLAQFGQQLTFQAMQVAGCNRLHPVDQRLAKWLLMSQDRLGGDLVPLTQEFLAHMLGTRRASVTVAAGQLQKRGLISYKRGEVRVRNRRGLENASCECYETLERQNEAWNKELN
ncbi:MAG: Crp/Fnr family transcriptional regulator [Candidatus Acidiferrales bacterium]